MVYIILLLCGYGFPIGVFMKRKYYPIPGQIFNRLMFIKDLNKYNKWGARLGLFKCKCGNVKELPISTVCRGITQSCKCLNNEKLRNRCLKHGGYKSRLYKIWEHMKDRCYNVKSDNYKHYGGRGIIICDEWKVDFKKFMDWANDNGYDDKLTIERKDIDKNYCPENCIWIINEKQSSNTRRTILIKAFGEEKISSEWARDKRCSVTGQTLRQRIKMGCDPELAITRPPFFYKRRCINNN